MPCTGSHDPDSTGLCAVLPDACTSPLGGGERPLGVCGIHPRMTGTRGAILPDERRRLIAQRLRQHGSVSVSGLEAEFRISPMTARRDLDELERRGVARRTHGGAVLPGLSSHEDSFLQRLEVEVDAKERLADAVLSLLQPGEAIFVDSSTTAFFAARRIVRENLQCTLLTNAVPIMDLLCEVDAGQVELVAAGGTLRKFTRSFVGPVAVRSIEAHFADHVIFSVRGLTPDGFLTDPDPLEAEVKRAMIRRARQAVLLVDGTKFDRPALTAIADITQVGVILAADVSEAALRPLARAGADVRRV
jgi:DeoR/GlpR family transcriptional regulator of sugar metabolism